jgi:hypothetical protein
MPVEKFYCGNCGSPLYFGAKFKEHLLARSCPACQRLNPVYFRYCYRCGTQLQVEEAERASDDTM